MPKYGAAKNEAFQELTVQYRHGYLSIPCLLGGVGIGKTEMAEALSVEAGEKLIDDCMVFEPIPTGEASDPTDTSGIPWVITVDGEPTKSEYRVLWALNRAAWDACHHPCLLLFDDIDKATPIVVNSLLHLFVHRRFKDFTLHPKTLMMCAGNRTTDDVSANALSESIRTRVTPIEVEADFKDFSQWALDVPDGQPAKVHPTLLGFLNYKPDLLHKHDEKMLRFPTPRGYRETSLHMYEFPETKGWHRLVERKLGKHVAADFWSWFTILSKIDVDHLLDHGTLKSPISAEKGTPVEVAQRMAEFASVFALTERLNQKIRDDHNGLPKFIDNLSPELQVAFLLQLREPTKRDFRNFYKNAAGKIMGNIIKDSQAGASP